MLATKSLNTHSKPMDPAAFFLPIGYIAQARNTTLDTERDLSRDGAYWSPWRIKDAARWQKHVYALAGRLAQQAIHANNSAHANNAAHANNSAPINSAIQILDVGCGVCVKLNQHLIIPGANATGIDQRSALDAARSLGCNATLYEVDLETANLNLNQHFDIIICADVLEHLINPDYTLALMARHAAPHTRVILSTPERHRERGRDCNSSNKPEHVREWAFAEFAAYINSRGWRVLSHRLCTKDDAPILPARASERAFRASLADRSPLCCQVIVCQPPASTNTSTAPNPSPNPIPNPTSITTTKLGDRP